MTKNDYVAIQAAELRALEKLYRYEYLECVEMLMNDPTLDRGAIYNYVCHSDIACEYRAAWSALYDLCLELGVKVDHLGAVYGDKIELWLTELGN